MTDGPIEGRRFSDAEVQEILKNAVERAPSRAVARGEGLTLGELKAIGSEVGIDPGRIEDAARALLVGGQERANPFLGAPTRWTYERQVDGEWDPDATPDILSTIRRTMGTQGEVNEIRGSLEWSARGETGERYVTLSSRDGVTTVRSSANLATAAALTFALPGILAATLSMAGLATFVKEGSTIGLVLFLTLLPVLYPVLRTVFGRVSASESDRLREVVDEVARIAEASRDSPP